MRITKISACRVELPLHESSYKCPGSNSVSIFASVVAIKTDAGKLSYQRRRSGTYKTLVRAQLHSRGKRSSLRVPDRCEPKVTLKGASEMTQVTKAAVKRRLCYRSPLA